MSRFVARVSSQPFIRVGLVLLANSSQSGRDANQPLAPNDSANDTLLLPASFQSTLTSVVVVWTIWNYRLLILMNS